MIPFFSVCVGLFDDDASCMHSVWRFSVWMGPSWLVGSGLGGCWIWRAGYLGSSVIGFVWCR
jgi:hypothetical protein